MQVETLIEQVRGCGYRKPGLYLMCPAIQLEPCERLPFPCYGDYPRFARGWTEINPSWMFKPDMHPVCDPGLPGHHHDVCPVCTPPDGAHYLLWVGKKYYSTESFLKEAMEMGISKRIPNIPENFRIGHTWVYLAHKECSGGPGVFYVFKPTHVDLVVEDENNVPDKAEELYNRLEGHLRTVKVIPDDNE